MAMTKGPGEINMTPLIDVLLVLLIIFMVITPEKPLGLEARVPQDAVAEQPEDDAAVVVSVGPDQTLLINREIVRMEDLGGRLFEIFKTRALRVVFVKGDGGLDFEDVARVIDVARGAGIHHVGISTH
jgi:biopolymer transport protein TolR